MASIIRIDTPLSSGVNIDGYLPSLGVAGYTGRYRASHIPAGLGEPLDGTDVWPNDVGENSLSVRIDSGTTGPRVEALSDGSGVLAVAVPFGNQAGFVGGTQTAADRTIALLIGGAGTNDRYFAAYNGYFLSSTPTGWAVSTRSTAQAPTQRLAVTGATNAANTRYVVLLSSSTAGNLRLRVKKADEAVLTGTASAQPRGNDMEYKLSSIVYQGSTRGSHQIAHVATWDRVLTEAEEDSVIAALHTL